VAAILIASALLTAALVGPADRAGRWTADRLFGQKRAPAPACQAFCATVARAAIQRPEGPLPHDCRFFAECGCPYQCPTP